MISKQFEDKKYVILPKLLHNDSCKEYVEIIKKAIENKEYRIDDQCPTSFSLYNNPNLKHLLTEMLPHIESYSGKKLYPTYAYARLYQPGEELKVHRDRNACEISVTITLGFEGKKWPIYIGHNKDKSDATEITMEIGDAVLYRGIDVWHWRGKFEGEWQAQVFLHYVDANGPHKELKDDCSPEENNKNINDSEIPWYAQYHNIVDPSFIDKCIQKYTRECYERQAPYIGGSSGNIDLNIRDVDRVIINTISDLGSVLVSCGFNANNQWWKFNITHAHQAEFLIYTENRHYASHVDTFFGHNDNTRKLTALMFLNDNYEEGKFYLQYEKDKIYPEQKKGDVVIFPSFILHGVEPVTKGTRYTAVAWLEGPFFK